MKLETKLRSVYFPIALALLGAVLSTACSSPSGQKFPTVKGKVTLDGKPLAAGTITFIGTDERKASTVGSIKNGDYTIPAPPGPKKVEITSAVLGVAPATEPIPAKYNTATELTATTDDKGGVVNFDLKTN